MEIETIEQIAERFNKDERVFLCTEVLNIYFKSTDQELSLKALELLEKVAQPF